jgi:hypothetical protein
LNPPVAIRGRNGRLIGFSLGAAALVTWLRLLLVARLSDRGFFVKYVRFADEILGGRVPRARLGDVSPGYLWTTVALRSLHATGQDIITLQIIAVTLAALCLAVCAWRLAGPVAAFSTAVVLLANRAALVCATELEPETLILLMGSIGLAAVGSFAAANAAVADDAVADDGGRRGRARGGQSILLLAGLAFGISAICRPVALLVIAGLAVWLWRRTRRGAVSFLIAAAVPIAIVLAISTALSGEALIMDPGTVFFEGMNPLAAGYAGVQPRIVNDLEAVSSEPDFLHVAYRIVAARATGSPMNRSASNHYWSSKAWSFVRTEPAAAIRLTLRKLILACQSYDAYDLSTMVRKSDAMDRLPWLPFGFVLALAVGALLMSRGETAASVERRALRPPSGGGLADVSSAAITYEILTPIVIVTLGNAVSLAAFYVTARGRNALLPGLSLLAGIGIALIVDIARRERRRALVVLLLILASTLILSLDGDAQREDRHGWSASFHAGAAQSAAQAATARGALRDAAVFRAIAATWRPADSNAVDRTLLAAVALKELGEEATPERRFDLALALQNGGDWSSSASVLDVLSAAGYKPRRENRVVSSVAFYQARAALRLGSAALARQHLARAALDAPGDPYVMALLAELEPQARAARRELDELHDPFTASLAMASAQADAGDARGSAATLEALIRAFPEWTRPRAVAAMIR